MVYQLSPSLLRMARLVESAVARVPLRTPVVGSPFIVGKPTDTALRSPATAASFPTPLQRLMNRADLVIADDGVLLTPTVLHHHILEVDGPHDVRTSAFADMSQRLQSLSTTQKHRVATWLFDIIDALFVEATSAHQSIPQLTDHNRARITQILSQLTCHYERFACVERAIKDGHVGLQARLIGTIHSSLSQGMTIIAGELSLMDEALEDSQDSEDPAAAAAWAEARNTFDWSHRFHTVPVFGKHYRITMARREIAEWVFQRLIGRHPSDKAWRDAPAGAITWRWESVRPLLGNDTAVLVVEFPHPTYWAPEYARERDFCWPPNLAQDRYLQTYLHILGWRAQHHPTANGFEVRLRITP